MVETYGIKKRGRYHECDHSVCQDAYKIVVKDNCVFAAVADGVGSNTHSHISSQLAVDEVTDYCAERMDESKTEEEILDLIKEAFLSAKGKINLKAKEEKEKCPEEHQEYQFHTTLSFGFYKDGKLYYGQSGDSGIFALTKNGSVKLVTMQQRDAEGRVYPLAYGENYWQFGVFEEEAASVMLVTDGVLEAMTPKCLLPTKEKIYVAMACYFMDNAILQFPERDVEQIRSSREKYVENVIAKEIYDDLTVAVVVDTKQEVSYKEASYYNIPDVIKEKYKENETCECQEVTEEIMNCPTESQAEEKEPSMESVENTTGLPKFTMIKSVLQKLKRK